mgnify:CR=1 FL=1
MTKYSKTTALDLPPLDPLPEKTQAYFDICEDKLGMVPNVLLAHAFDISKLDAFSGLYNTLMLADSGLSKLEREMIAVVVSSINKCFYCLTAHGAAVRELAIIKAVYNILYEKISPVIEFTILKNEMK